MRSAVVILSLISAAVAEAPYHLPRPAPHAPVFNYPSAPVPSPILRPHPPPIPIHHSHPQPAPQPNFSQGSGYHYQQPSPAFIQQALQPQPQYQPQPQIQPAPLPRPQYQQPQPQYQQPQPQYQQPQPQYQQPQPQYQQPQPQYQQPQPQYQPQPLPAPIQFSPESSPAPLPINYPSTSYGVPQPQIAPRPIINNYVAPQPQPQPQPAPVAPITYYQNQQYSQQGYSYAQPLAQSIQATSTLPLQSQALSANIGTSGLSSYQADNNLYSATQAQTHNEALDSVVVNRVQSIIKENEHSTARDAGYLSLVSGVSLENAKPSVEISSFVQNSPVTSFELGSSSSTGSSSSSSSYSLPTVVANSQTNQVDSGVAFLPSSKPATSYGPPN